MRHWQPGSSVSDMNLDRAWVEINLDAIAHNIQQVRAQLAVETHLMVIVKADAYGHGAIAVAETALDAGATWLGVATIPEGIVLREAGIIAPILILGATNLPEQVQAMVQWHLQPTLVTPKQALVFAETLQAQNASLSVHLKLDTGMSRLGTNWEEAAHFIQGVKHLPNLAIASIYTHFATADDPDPTMLNLQHQRFLAALQSAGIDPDDPQGPKLHCANSAATITDPRFHHDMVRTGLITYGLYPAPHLKAKINLQSSLQVKARITQVKSLAAGTGVSYGHRYVADSDRTIAVIGIGYADGVPRNLSTKIDVLLRGQRVRQLGSITMDQIILDVTDMPGVKEGEVVTLLGQDGSDCISADDWADLLGTISWEILCGFKLRLPRVLVSQDLAANKMLQATG
ncbi:MAG: alanine racemase [Alkalinema sp. RU_4_3]|nr:alanine racemase [Alkalinema sp. RU_4_3]